MAMTQAGWRRTSEWWRALREVSDELERRRDGVLPWHPRYAEIFGDRAGLRRALRYRWKLIAEAQEADPEAPTLDQILHEDALFERHRGLLLVVREQPVPA